MIGWLVLGSALAHAQVDKMIDRFLGGESRLRPEDLGILELGSSPDPVREGDRVDFQVTITNDSRRSGRINIVIKDGDEVAARGRDIDIRPGENRIDFPGTNYRFSRRDHCFTVLVDIERSERRIDLTKEFCARRTYSGWTLKDRGVGPLYVEDLDIYPDPATPGQDIGFRVRLRNDGRPIRGNLRIQDKDQVIVQTGDVSIPRGSSDLRFPQTRYSFQRFDHCFTVVVDVEGTPYAVDAAREFCAKPMGWTLPGRPERARKQSSDKLDEVRVWLRAVGYVFRE